MGSSPISATIRPVGQAVKTPPFHGGNGSSILPRVTSKQKRCCTCVTPLLFTCYLYRIELRKFSLAKGSDLFFIIIIQTKTKSPSRVTKQLLSAVVLYYVLFCCFISYNTEPVLSKARSICRFGRRGALRESRAGRVRPYRIPRSYRRSGKRKDGG